MTAERVNNFFQGDFTGYFYTKQELPFSYYDDLPKEIVNQLQIYKGELANIEPLTSFESEQFYTFSDLRVESAKNIEFIPSKGAEAFTVNPINNFRIAILKDFKILDTWSLNGKTYGLIKGVLVGEVEYFVQRPTANEVSIVQPLGSVVPPVIDSPYSVSSSNNKGCLAWLSRWWVVIIFLILMILMMRECYHRDEVKSLQDRLNSCEEYGEDAEELERRRRTHNAGTGEVTVTLMWSSEDDLDLKVIDPHSDVIAYNNKSVLCGGKLDVDKNVGTESVMNPIENVFWESDAAEGEYKVIITLYEKKSNYAEIPYYLKVLVNGEILTYNGSLKFDKEEKEVVFIKKALIDD
jgi:hypothetical protein